VSFAKAMGVPYGSWFILKAGRRAAAYGATLGLFTKEESALKSAKEKMLNLYFYQHDFLTR
jgi:hypothetical protein